MGYYNKKCVICGDSVNGDYLFCRQCYYKAMNKINEIEFDIFTPYENSSEYFATKDECFKLDNIEDIKENILYLYALAHNHNNNFNSKLLDRVEDDILEILDNVDYDNAEYDEYENYCAYCGEYSYKYELCSDCYQLSKEDYIIKNSNGEWIKNIIKGNEYKFFDENKNYTLKTASLNEFEMRYFNITRKNIKSKYMVVPQVNLQSIIDTDSNKRNDELFRNVDFVIFKAKEFIPILAIELNGAQHYDNEYWIERDKSVRAILNKVELPLLTIDIKEIKQLSDESIYKINKKVLSYIDPSFFRKLFYKQQNKLDLEWTKTFIQKEIHNKTR